MMVALYSQRLIPPAGAMRWTYKTTKSSSGRSPGDRAMVYMPPRRLMIFRTPSR